MYTCIYHTAWTSGWTGRLILVSFHTYEQRFSLNLCGVFQEDVHSISTLDSKFQTVSGNDSDFILKVEQKALRVPWWGRFHHDLGSGEVPPDPMDKGFWWSMGCETFFFVAWVGLGWTKHLLSSWDVVARPSTSTSDPPKTWAAWLRSRVKCWSHIFEGWGISQRSQRMSQMGVS